MGGASHTSLHLIGFQSKTERGELDQAESRHVVETWPGLAVLTDHKLAPPPGAACPASRSEPCPRSRTLGGGSSL